MLQIMHPAKRKVLAWALLLTLSFIWGSSYILIKKALIVFRPAEITHMRIVSAAIVLLPYALPVLTNVTKRQYGILALDGLLGTLFPLLLYITAQQHIDSGIHGVINALTPIFVLLMGLFFFKKKVLKKQMLGVTLSLIGAVLLTFAESGWQPTTLNYYILLSLVGSCLYGNTTYLIKYYLSDLKSSTIAAMPMLLLAPISGLYLILYPGWVTKIVIHPEGFYALLFVLIAGIINLGIANLIFAELVKITSPVFTSTESLLAPLVSLAWGIVDGESLFYEHYLAAMIILIGVYFLNQSE